MIASGYYCTFSVVTYETKETLEGALVINEIQTYGGEGQ